MDTQVIASTLLELFSLILLGYILNKLKVMDSSCNSKVSNLIICVTAPLMIISSVGDTSAVPGGAKTVWSMLIGGFAYFIIMPVIAKVMLKPFRLSATRARVYELLFVFTNLGFMGFPVIKAIYGPGAVFLMAIPNMAFGVCFFTYGVYVLRGSSEEGGFEWKRMCNPGVVASLLAMVIYLAGWHLPQPVLNVTGMVGDVTVPLSMMIIGSSLAMVPLKKLLDNFSIYILTALSLLVRPFLVYVIAGAVLSEPMAVGVFTIAAAMPAASMVVILCSKYDMESETASVGVFLTTAFSVLTIPLIVHYLLS